MTSREKIFIRIVAEANDNFNRKAVTSALKPNSEEFRYKHDRFETETIMNARCPKWKALLQYNRRKDASEKLRNHQGGIHNENRIQEFEK